MTLNLTKSEIELLIYCLEDVKFCNNNKELTEKLKRLLNRDN